MNFVERLEEFQKQIQYSFQNRELIAQAFTHKSFAFESLQGQGDNERLEFLGDAVLNLVLAQELMVLFPNDMEGALSKKRASLVNEMVFAEQAKILNLGDFLRLGKGEISSGGLRRPRILASTYEAVIGAYFIERGYELTCQLIRQHFGDRVLEISLRPDFEKDFKSRLQELSQNYLKVTPTYTILSESGPPHARVFVSTLILGENQWSGEGPSKKISEQAAAEKALAQLDTEEMKSAKLSQKSRNE